mmetsp:Transcript_5639/g.15786  ORF Transcript_5639/g.15786 Transcript_5639/m.15786 type:complete len:131 (+) Transcript_5639:35-427(+)|eukprot:CAMPEP_0117652418 /NCGR_PEP_ID=MMETSP0804-20121206/2618_1 /TAXON_ID=1074897 /ORGANISM="Tetraselmis astigmatica, Strain CCMP880" /LENGTH=130 /DNA_ID=CAMNT_0005458467 /DNA_START=22 /DNA_END=414 /DNA_ORIENTATION=-
MGCCRYWGIGSGVTEQQLRSYHAVLRPLEGALEEHGGPFLIGPNVTQANVILFPFMERFDLIASKIYGRDAAAVTGQPIQAWLRAMKQRPSVSKASADPSLLLKAYQKHKCLDFFDFTTYGAADHPKNHK